MKNRFFLFCGFFLLLSNFVYAGNATWNLNPTSSDWDSAANWTPNTVPNGPADVAAFGASTINSVVLSAATEVSAVDYDSTAAAFITTVPGGIAFIVSGMGITNDSGMIQNFVAEASTLGGGTITFNNTATAGSKTKYVSKGAAATGIAPGRVIFNDTSTAGEAIVITNGAATTGGGGAFTEFHNDSTAGDAILLVRAATAKSNSVGAVSFFDNSSAGNSQITIEPPSGDGQPGGFVQFFDTSSAGNAIITVEDTLYFRDSSTAGNATLIVNASAEAAFGGTVQFFGGNGGSARLEIFGNATAGSGTGGSGKSWGSIEGDGTVFIGSPGVAIGSNNLSTIFTGLLADGFLVGPLTKVGTGTLTLGGANTYTGGTIIEGGELVINNMTGSGTGTGAVQVNAGALGGVGSIAGAVTVGTGSGSGATLAPGRRGGKPGKPLTMQSAVAFNSDATYKCELNTTNAKTDHIVANGVTINNAHFSLRSHGGLTLQTGTVLTVIGNTAATPIVGVFANLPDGGTVTIGSNTFQANYEGGDGNDLTLTVVH